MAITSSSTRAEVLAQYNNNLAWDGNPTSAALAFEAGRWLLVNRPQSISQDGKGQMNYESLKEERVILEKYIGDFGGTVNSVSFVKGRPLT